MHEAVLMTPSDALQTLIGHESDSIFIKLVLVLLDMLVEVCLHEFEDKEEVVFLANDLFELDDVWVGKFAEGFDFAQGHGFVPGGKGLLHFFDGDDFVACFVAGFGDGAEGAIADFPNCLIFLH